MPHHYIQVPQTGINYIFNFKSGSTLFSSALRMALTAHGIGYETNSEADAAYRNVILVRNPVDRLFSGFFWLQGDFMPDHAYQELELLEQAGVKNLSDYLAYYPDFVKESSNGHYVPQSQDLLNLDLREISDYDAAYRARFGDDYVIVRSEDIGEVLEGIRLEDLSSLHLPQLFFGLPPGVSLTFFLAYQYYNRSLDVHHHQHWIWTDLVDPQDYLSITSFFGAEMQFLGYTAPALKQRARDFKRLI